MNALPQAAPRWIDEAEYLQYCEQYPENKFELIDGEIVAMAGASLNHNILVSNLTTLFNNHLADTPCLVLASDWKVRVEHNFYYPDVVVDCDSENHQPKLIVEVLSDSTRSIDLSVKLEDYQKIPSLQEYVVIEQAAKLVMVYRRKNHWQAEIYQSGDIVLESIGLTVSVENIYRKVIFKVRNLRKISN